MMTSKSFQLTLLIVALHGTFSDAFLFTPHDSTKSWQRVEMVGGRGWDNSDYLSGLSGDDKDRQKASEDYQEFSDRRQAFVDRQKEIMKTPQGRAFLEKQQGQQMDSPLLPREETSSVTPGSAGGSRMAQMMEQAKRMKEMQDEMKYMGFEQKLAVPLDDDDDGDEKEVL